MFELEKEHTMFLLFHSIFEILNIFKEYLKLLNRLYDITWFGSVYEAVYKKLKKEARKEHGKKQLFRFVFYI
jgi:hypothetical protein